jgi:hypothetical protein
MLCEVPLGTFLFFCILFVAFGVADVEICFGARQLCFLLLFFFCMKFEKGRDLSGFSKVEDDMTVRETRAYLKAFACREMRCNAARTGCFSRAGLLITTSICICVFGNLFSLSFSPSLLLVHSS